MRKTFTASGQYSTEFIAMRGGVDIGVTIDAGSNSLTVEKMIDGVWYTYGSAVTSNGGGWRLSNGVDYHAPCRMRVKCGTFDTGPTHADIDGDILASGVTQISVGPRGRYLENLVDQRLLENGDFRLLEDA